MKNVLLITSSPRGEASHSTQVAKSLAADLGGSLVLRDLWRESLAPIGPEFVHAAYTPEEARTPEQRAILLPSDEAIAQVKAADVVVVAAGMINFGMPAALKTWIDLISRAGITFRYGESGPEGLLTGKKLILVLASGGVYSSGPFAAMDHLEPALRANLGFLGLTDVETIRIEGVAYGAEALEKALSQAEIRSREVLAAAA